ncbi:NUDIX domain-containing protein [Chromobacterium haemolyticum]|uniref:NUDIX domain-containing protein n=1 Tax=Chromobacterium haemolyticum TaxID=394935 RepID=UPI001F085D8C|nr:NUDIX domain-containing protein [Chromobacterium haemolyticum]
MLWSLAARAWSRLRGAAPAVEPAPPAIGKRQRAAIAIVDGGRILLMHRVKPGKDYYVLPGGGIKRRETAAIACVRETREETGLNVRLGGMLCVLDAKDRVEHVFLAASHAGELRLGGPELAKMGPDNLYELEWLDSEQLRRVKLKPKGLLPHCLALLEPAAGR